eukprot:g8108.t1
MAHSFFCSCHGKGPSDGETGLLKTKARDCEAEGIRIPDSEAFYRIIKGYMGGILDRTKNKRGKHSIYYRRVFYYVKRGAVLRRRKSDLPEDMDGEIVRNHCFMSMGRNGNVRSRLLPCPCKKCWDVPHFYSSDCEEKEHNEAPEEHKQALAVHTDESGASLLERERRLEGELNGATGVTVDALCHNDEGEAAGELAKAMGRLFWMADVEGKTFKHQGNQMIKAHVYDQSVEEQPQVGARAPCQRIVYLKPAAQKCPYQDHKTGKCSEMKAHRQCTLWHWQAMPVGSVRPPLLTTRVAPLDFVLQAAVAADISDTIAKDEEYFNNTTPAPI